MSYRKLKGQLSGDIVEEEDQLYNFEKILDGKEK
jgi:hypothetical protein